LGVNAQCPESEVRMISQHPPLANFGFERTLETDSEPPH
jgi:hypothetical protein